MAGTEGKEPLAGLVVIDLGQIYAAPYATLLLALGGATVIKVEPVHGEHLRVRGQVGGPRYAFANLHSNKNFVTLNLKDDRGKDLLKQLVAKADVLVENYRPGVMERLGVGADVLRAINPRLVYAQSSGFGRSGPYREYPAMDLSVQAISGVLGVTGFPDGPPVKSGPAICDFFGGIHLYGGILTALYRRERTGGGAVVEISMHEAVYASMMSNLGHFFSSGVDGFRSGNRHGGYSVVPYNVYAAKDGHVGIICESDGHWRKLLEVMGRHDLVDDPRYAQTKDRVAHIDAIDELVGDWVGTLGKEDVFAKLRDVGVPVAPVQTLSEVTTDPHHYARGMLQDIEHPELGTVTVPHSPILLEDVGRKKPRPSGALGQDNEQVYGDWLGLDRTTLDEFAAAGVI
ncbi:MAG: CoA transferase [Streptosporangiales bacterium]|nr:CoA transferase [Streptosporangiales bacterium]